jgi:hypothetical protein
VRLKDSRIQRVVKTGYETPMAEAPVGRGPMGVFGVLRGPILVLQVMLMAALIGMSNIQAADTRMFTPAVVVVRRRSDSANNFE